MFLSVSQQTKGGPSLLHSNTPISFILMLSIQPSLARVVLLIWLEPIPANLPELLLGLVNVPLFYGRKVDRSIWEGHVIAIVPMSQILVFISTVRQKKV